MIKLIILSVVMSLLMSCVFSIPILMCFDVVPIWATIVSMSLGIVSSVSGVFISIKIMDRYK